MYDPVFILNVKTVITAANVVLLVLLLAMYIQSYHRIKSKFTLGLMIFASFLLLQAVILTPCIAAACGRQMCVVGPLDRKYSNLWRFWCSCTSVRNEFGYDSSEIWI
jgi:intracellular septation protein A